MATEKQLLKLEKISKIVNHTKNKDIPKALGRGRIGYERAIKSMMLVGEMAIVTAILSVAVAVVFLAVKFFTVYGGPKQYEINLALIAIVSGVLSGVLGYKLWGLCCTPLFTLVALIVILICNLVLCAGIIPAIVVVLDIIALSRYSTFCSWFHGVD